MAIDLKPRDLIPVFEIAAIHSQAPSKHELHLTSFRILKNVHILKIEFNAFSHSECSRTEP